MTYLATILISAVVAIVSTVTAYNYAPLSFIERFGPKDERVYGSTITTIQGTDTIRDSRSTINTNFTNLNTDKIEVSTTTIGNITSLPNLATVGTITSGTWQGTGIDVARQGTGSTSPTSNQVILGNGASGFKVVSGFGSSGQFLQSQGSSQAPTWETSAIDQAAAYSWSGQHKFWTAPEFSSFTATSTTATSTMSNGLSLSGGCFSVNGACMASSTTMGNKKWRLATDLRLSS